MFREGTLIVLGAASSLDFGFPLGVKLKQEIKDLMMRDSIIDDESGLSHPVDRLADARFSQALAGYFGSDRPYSLDPQVLSATQIVRGGISFSSSIDNFLLLRASEKYVVECARAAIAWIILHHEHGARSKFGLNASETVADVSLENTWLQVFAEICFSDAQRNKIEEALDRVTVVSFNYDRNFVLFVQKAISGLYSINSDDAARLTRKLKIIFPYGSLGDPFDSFLRT